MTSNWFLFNRVDVQADTLPPSTIPRKCLLSYSRQSQPTTTSHASVELPISISHSSTVHIRHALSTCLTIFAVLLDSLDSLMDLLGELSSCSRRFSNTALRSSPLRTRSRRAQAQITSVALLLSTRASQCQCTCEHCQRTHLITIDVLLVLLPDFFPPTSLLLFSSYIDSLQFFLLVHRARLT